MRYRAVLFQYVGRFHSEGGIAAPANEWTGNPEEARMQAQRMQALNPRALVMVVLEPEDTP